jgi:hypothetical protein
MIFTQFSLRPLRLGGEIFRVLLTQKPEEAKMNTAEMSRTPAASKQRYGSRDGEVY